MKIKKGDLTRLIQERIRRVMSEMYSVGPNLYTFEFKDLEVGPVTVMVHIEPYRAGSRIDPPSGGEVTIKGLSLTRGSEISMEELVKMENALLLQVGERPLTVEDMTSWIETVAADQDQGISYFPSAGSKRRN